jgi:ABC-2 type transport system ATP-binding protein
MERVIEVEGLTKRYKGADADAVKGISFSVRQGQFFTLLGPNGAGKTTTISILTTTLAPTGGRATVVGFDVSSQQSQVRRRVGIIFQRRSLDQNLTAEENVRFHTVLYGMYPWRPAFRLMPKEYRDRVGELASMLGIEADMSKPVRTLSGGMQRKLEIVRSLMHRPAVLFLDEPTAGLDPQSRRNLWEHLRDSRERSGTTVFLTTHYIDEAEECDAVCILNSGRIVAEGSPADVKAELTAQYLLVDAHDRARLREELRARAVPFRETPLFRIELDGTSAHQVLRSIETPLTVLRTHAPSLEDAYLDIIGKQTE